MVLRLVIAVTFILYTLLTIVRRLFFHPLSKFPGPKRAAVSILYEFYHDAIRGGQYCFVIEKMHQRYGPIVRISPDELHVSDPSFIKELYSGNGKIRNRPVRAAHQFGVPESVGGSPNHDVHKLRRASLANFFSKASIAKIEPLILEQLSILCEQVELLARRRLPVDLNAAFGCLTGDIVHLFAFKKPSNFLQYPGFETPFSRAFKFSFTGVGYIKHLPWLYPLLDIVSEFPFFKPTSDIGWLAAWRKEIRADISEYKRSVDNGRISKSEEMGVFGDMLLGELPQEEKSISRLTQEGALLIAAGTETTGWVLSFIIYHAIANPMIMKQLKEEMQLETPEGSSPPPLARLQNLPYLISHPFPDVVSEGLRLGFGVCARVPRTAPTETMTVTAWSPSSPENDTTWEIPPGSTVSMSSAIIHMDPEIFPQPKEFRPERWIENRRLDQYLLSFAKGPRQCLGINLAYAELYLVVAGIVCRFGDRMTLHNTTEENVVFTSDRFVPYPKKERKVEVMISPVG